MTGEAELPAVAGRADRHARRISRKIAAIAAVIAALMWMFIGWLIWSEHESALRHGMIEGRNLAAAFAVDLTHTLDHIDGAMDAILRRAPMNPNGTPRLPELQEWVKDFQQLAAPAKYLVLVDPHGQVVFSSVPNAKGLNGSSVVNVKDREHFRIQRDHPDTGLYISVPLKGRMADGSMLFFTRRITMPDKSFGGVLVFAVPPVELTRLHEKISLGDHGALAVIGVDDIVRIRVSADHPDGSVGLGTSLRGEPWPRNVRPGASGSYYRVGVLTPIERQFNYRRLEKYPLIVNVGFDLNDLLGGAERRALILCLIGVAMTTLVFGLAMLLVRELNRRVARVIELASERVHLEEARLLLQQEQEKLSRANQVLVEAAEHAEAASRAKTRFLANMSHELRTPLHAIIGFSELIQSEMPRIDKNSSIGDFAGDILAAGRHLLALINAILDISKVESGTERLSESSVQLVDEVNASLVAVVGRARERGIKIRVSIPEKLPPIWIDATKLRQILINLMSNAVKFTEGGGQVSLVASVARDRGLVLSVMDTGVGMNPDEVDIALQPFGQVDNSLSRTHEGTGLGLPLSQRLTELHGGSLQIESIKGVGTTVRVWLPAERWDV